MSALVFLMIWGGLVAWSVNVARKRRRSPAAWGVLTLLVGIFAVILLYILPTKAQT